jgi:hypothetical protein
VDEVLRFRHLVLSNAPFTQPGGAVVLRSSQEEMWGNTQCYSSVCAAMDGGPLNAVCSSGQGDVL